MSACVTARSISRPVWQRVQMGSFAARALAVFEHACNLVAPDGYVLTLVLPPTGDGPLNVVVDGALDGFGLVEPGMPAVVGRSRIGVGGLQVALEDALIWEPLPDWKRLRIHKDTLTDRMSLVQSLAQHQAPDGSFLVLTSDAPGGSTARVPGEPVSPAFDAVFAVAQKILAMLQAGWEGNTVLLRTAASQLAGLGGGLTPAGDDFLGGAMLWAWAAHPIPRSLCRVLVEAAAPLTTTLSAALLRAAARGECSAAWHSLLAALSQGGDADVAKAVQGVLSHGATSGADALAGFLWAGLCAAS